MGRAGRRKTGIHLWNPITHRVPRARVGAFHCEEMMEDHSGFLLLEDAPWCASGGTGAGLILVFPLHHKETVGPSKVLEET